MLVEACLALAVHLAGWGLLRGLRPGWGAWTGAAMAFPVGLAAYAALLGMAFLLHLPFRPGLTAVLLLAAATASAGRGGAMKTWREASALAAGLAGCGIAAALAAAFGPAAMGEDSRWFIAIGEQIATSGGMSDSLRGQLGTRPFLLPLLIAAAQAAGREYPAFLGPLCGIHTVLAVAVFARRLFPGDDLPSRLVPPVLALCLGVSAPFLWSTVYVGPHAAFLLFYTIAAGGGVMAAAGGGRPWAALIIAGSAGLCMSRVEGSLTAAPLLAAILGATALPLAWRARVLVLAGGFQALWHALVLASCKGYGGLRAIEIITFGAIPGGVALAAVLLALAARRLPVQAAGLAGRIPALTLAALAAALVLHEAVQPWSTLRAIPISAHFLFVQPSGFALPLAASGLAIVLAARRRRSPAARVMETTLIGHLLIVMLIAAHSPHQDPNIIDSTDRMLLHALPLLALYPWLLRPWPLPPPAAAAPPEPARRRRPVRSLMLTGLALIALGLSGWLVKERYYLRMLPVPAALFGVLNSPAVAMPLVPSPEPALPSFDLEDDAGLRAAIAFVRGWSPTSGTQTPFTEGGTAQWLEFLRSTPLYCTDAAQMMMLIAARQGHPVREIHLYATPGRQDGNAHTIMEFWSPRRGQWVAVDAQTATLYRRATDGAPLSLIQAIESPAIDYERVVPGLTGLDPAPLLRAGSRQAVISQIVPAWLGTRQASVPLGYALMVPGQTHAPPIVRTKQAAAMLGLVLLLLAWGLISSPGRN